MIIILIIIMRYLVIWFIVIEVLSSSRRSATLFGIVSPIILSTWIWSYITPLPITIQRIYYGLCWLSCVYSYITQIHNSSLEFSKTVLLTRWHAGWVSPFNFVQGSSVLYIFQLELCKSGTIYLSQFGTCTSSVSPPTAPAGDIATPPILLSVCPSVRPSVRHV